MEIKVKFWIDSWRCGCPCNGSALEAAINVSWPVLALESDVPWHKGVQIRKIFDRGMDFGPGGPEVVETI
jgi:hypothetical protein